MNKLLTLTALPFLTFSLFKCSNSSASNTNYAAKYNPSEKYNNNNIHYHHFSINGYDYEPSQEDASKLSQMIVDADFKSTNETSSTTKSFKYTIRISALLFGYNQYTYTFYYDGFASITQSTGQKDKNDNYIYETYNYKCDDVKDAEAIYDYANQIVEDYREEQRQMKEASETANEIVNSFTLEDALDDIREMNPLTMAFHYHDYTDYSRSKSDLELEDDGTIKDLVLNATYAPFPNSNVGSAGLISTDIYIGRPMMDGNNEEYPVTYSFQLNEETLTAELNVYTKDKFDRSYAKRAYFTLDRAIIHSIFDNAFRLYEAKHPVEEEIDQ